ncbi:MAG: 3-isopropylmalate dehydratase small subunit [Candidatus Omnitrophica bacterium]|nr:3-isopropylmalate dehydratase small subunit [Candidatus Omnitrophota bacterium]MCM8798338.1 3-isopropylmalate dehydratase small subunit [Candidatus Omnitrophota bacterium]
MVIKGKALILGDDINTDLIIPARFLTTTSPEELGKNLFADSVINFSQKIEKGDIIVAGKNFGCGSSREHAPLAIKGAGISCVVALSFARIFFRNAINIGLPIIESKDAKEIKEGDDLEIDLQEGKVKNLTQNKIYTIQPFPEFLEELINQGGLMNWIKNLLLRS